MFTFINFNKKYQCIYNSLCTCSNVMYVYLCYQRHTNLHFKSIYVGQNKKKLCGSGYLTFHSFYSSILNFKHYIFPLIKTVSISIKCKNRASSLWMIFKICHIYREKISFRWKWIFLKLKCCVMQRIISLRSCDIGKRAVSQRVWIDL
jgi:hypothetical protein